MGTVFWTIIAGVVTYLAGQLALKLVLEPVQDLRRTIGAISHSLIERANVIANPGVPTVEVMDATSQELRKLSSQLHSHLYLVPAYSFTSRIFFLPKSTEVREAATMLIGLSNGVHRATGGIYEENAKRVERICDLLRIYLPDHERISKVAK